MSVCGCYVRDKRFGLMLWYLFPFVIATKSQCAAFGCNSSKYDTYTLARKMWYLHLVFGIWGISHIKN